MFLRSFAGILAGFALLLLTSLSHAQCTMDTDCKGERVCEGGQCVAGRPAAPAAPAAGAAQASPPAVAPAPATPPPVSEPEKPKTRRHSTGMMVGGIVMVSLTPVALLVSGVAALGKGLCEASDSDTFNTCDDSYDPIIYGALVSAVVLVGVGIPLLVIGAKKEPASDSSATATISPWATPSAAGLGLRIDL